MASRNKAYITGSGTIAHETLGTVRYVVRASARRLIARWHGDGLSLTVPPGMTETDFAEALRRMLPDIQRIKPTERLYDFGQMMDYGDLIVRITGIDGYGRNVTIRQSDRRTFEIRLASEADIASHQTVKAISNAMRAIAKFMAPNIILPRARELAEKVGRRPTGWELTNGVRVLGHCNSRGIIALSYALVYLPPRLRDYIIYHELAHLSEMNHSAAFHQLCNRYCGGDERRLIAELKASRLPLV